MRNQLHAPAALRQGKGNRHSLDRRLCGPEYRSGHGLRDKCVCAGNRTSVLLQLEEEIYGIGNE